MLKRPGSASLILFRSAVKITLEQEGIFPRLPIVVASNSHLKETQLSVERLRREIRRAHFERGGPNPPGQTGGESEANHLFPDPPSSPCRINRHIHQVELVIDHPKENVADNAAMFLLPRHIGERKRILPQLRFKHSLRPGG